jgi:hypothetical protein
MRATQQEDVDLKDNGLGALQRELAATPPAGLRALSDAEREDLLTAIRDAKRRQTAALTTAGEQALSQIPRVLRGPIRKMFR